MTKRVDLARYRADATGRLRLRDHDPEFLPGKVTSDEAEQMLESAVVRLRELQEKLYAQGRWSLLLVLQGMDTAGKDSAIEHVFSRINPQGCTVHSFKAPSDEELDHDYLWRTTLRLPRRGHIGIFNRSHYEETLAVRVHPDLLERQRLPDRLIAKRVWRERFEDIVGYERHLTRNGTVIRKIFLNISMDEQRRRLLKRLDDPTKHWKFSARDVDQRRHWREYMRAYEETIHATTTDDAPWYIVPADRKWWARVIISRIVVEALEGMRLDFPAMAAEQRRDLARIRRALGSRS